MQKQGKYCVMGNFIHSHKDSTGEFLDNLTYDEALATLKEWQNDKIHKQVTILGPDDIN